MSPFDTISYSPLVDNMHTCTWHYFRAVASHLLKVASVSYPYVFGALIGVTPFKFY